MRTHRARSRRAMQPIHQESLFAILQQTWVSGKIPELWKTAHVVPDSEKGDLSSPENYRTISLMSTLLKLLLRF